MDNKYQIFISSTFDDLKKHRDYVIKAILEMGHIPVGMEMFSAADEEQWKLIARQIDQSDYYVVIVAHRYGSMVDGMGYTEKEFDYAVSKGVPVYGFVVDSSVEPLAKQVDTDEHRIVALEKFKSKVKARPVTFWSTPEELGGKVPIALMKAFVTTPRPGWTRTATLAGPEVALELSRLSNENANLRAQLEAAVSIEKIDKRAETSSVISTLINVPKTLGLREKGKTSWEIEVKTNMYNIFTILAPALVVEMSENQVSMLLAISFRPKRSIEFSPNYPLARNAVAAIFADLHALELVEPSKKKHEVKDKEVYWSLSDLGREVMKLDRAGKLIKVASESQQIKTSKPSGES